MNNGKLAQLLPSGAHVCLRVATMAYCSMGGGSLARADYDRRPNTAYIKWKGFFTDEIVDKI